MGFWIKCDESIVWYPGFMFLEEVEVKPRAPCSRLVFFLSLVEFLILGLVYRWYRGWCWWNSWLWLIFGQDLYDVEVVLLLPWPGPRFIWCWGCFWFLYIFGDVDELAETKGGLGHDLLWFMLEPWLQVSRITCIIDSCIFFILDIWHLYIFDSWYLTFVYFWFLYIFNCHLI